MLRRATRRTSRSSNSATLAGGAIFACVLVSACGPRESANGSNSGGHHPASASASAAAATSAPATTEPAAGPAATSAAAGNEAGPAVAETLDAEGIAVERLAGGAIRVRGQDRWGVRLDTTYADATYFANAVPVIGRSLSDAQAQALTALVPRVQAAAAHGSATP